MVAGLNYSIEMFIQNLLPGVESHITLLTGEGRIRIDMLRTVEIAYSPDYLRTIPVKVKENIEQLVKGSVCYGELENTLAEATKEIENFRAYKDKYLTLKEVISDFNK